MKNIVFVATLIGQLLFFSFLSIFGLEYRGMEESSGYVIFCVLLAALTLLIFTSDYFIFRRFSLNLNSTILFVLPAFVALVYFIEKATAETAERSLIFYLLFSLPATYIGIYVARRRSIVSMAKWFEVLMLVMTLSVITSLILPLFRNEAFLAFAGSSHQTASYISAFAYSLNLFFLLFDHRYQLFRFHYTRIYKISSYILLLLQIAGVLYSGGRGGFVVIINATLILMWLKIRQENYGLKKISTILLFFALGFSFLLSRLLQNESFLASSGRVFSYISSGGIDISQTSGREFVYKDALKLITDKPILGYGLFKYSDFTIFPHNIFLEILLNGGIVYLSFTIILGYLFFKKFKFIIQKEPENILALAIFIFPITELMFSGTYLETPLFWFVIAYVFSYTVESFEIGLKNGFQDNQALTKINNNYG